MKHKSCACGGCSCVSAYRDLYLLNMFQRQTVDTDAAHTFAPASSNRSKATAPAWLREAPSTAADASLMLPGLSERMRSVKDDPPNDRTWARVSLQNHIIQQRQSCCM